MCYGFFQGGECCHADVGGLMDLFCHTSLPGHMSSMRHFSRVCSNTTQAQAGNGRQVENVWGIERPAPDAQRTIRQNIATWGNGLVYQREGCGQTFFDEGLPLNFSTVNSREHPRFPVIDPSGAGWTVLEPDATKQLIVFENNRSNVAGQVVFSFTNAGGLTTFGVVLRCVDKDNYLVLKIRTQSGPFTLEQVTGGQATVIATGTAPINFFFNSFYTMTFSATGSTVTATLNAGGNQASLSTTSAPTSSATRHGLFKSNVLDGAVTSILVSDVVAKSFVSVYNAAGAAAIAGQHQDTAAEVPKYSSSPLLAGTGAWQFKSGTTPLPNGAGVGAVGTGGPSLVWGGGRQISASAAVTARENLGWPVRTWQSTAARQIEIGSGGALVDFCGEPPTTSNFTHTTHQLGEMVGGTVAKHGWPNAMGVVLRSASVELVSRVFGDVQVGIFTVPGYYNLWVFSGSWALVVGEWVFEANFVPRIAEAEEVVTWQGQYGFVTTSTCGPDYPIKYTPEVEYARVNFLYPQLRPSGSSAIAPWSFDSTPGRESWWYGEDPRGFGRHVTVSPRSTPNGAGEWFDTTEGPPLPWKMKVAGGIIDVTGWEVTHVVLGTSAVAANWKPPGGQEYFEIRGGGAKFFYGQNGLVGGGPALMSDRFVYASLTFDTEANARAFSTANLANIPAGISLRSNDWAISLDGSIRFPLMAHGRPPAPLTGPDAYERRRRLEQDGQTRYPLLGPHVLTGQADFISPLDGDCIKSSDAFSPPLANPTF